MALVPPSRVRDVLDRRGSGNAARQSDLKSKVHRKLLQSLNSETLRLIEKMVAAAGRRIDEANPIVAARLADGSRVTAAIPPVTLDGPALSIRRFGGKVLSNDELLANQTLTVGMLQLLGACVRARL